jgi:hypothetical protein
MKYEIDGQTVTLPAVVGGYHIPAGHFDDPEVRAAFGAVEVPDPEPVPPTTAQRLAAVRQQATAIIQVNLPQPWEILKDQATPAFIEWADDYLGLVAAELARLETAIETHQEAIPDWPEVE